MKHLIKRLFAATFLCLISMSSYGISSLCGTAYVIPAGEVTFFHSVQWSGYEIILAENDINTFATTELVSPATLNWTTNVPNASSGTIVHYVYDPIDGLYEGGGYGVVDAGWYGQDVTYCWIAVELDTIPAPTVTLSLSPNPAVVGNPVTANWSSTGAVSCSWNNGNLPSTSGSGQLFSSVQKSNAGNYWVLCAAADGDTTQANVQLDVVECTESYTQYNYRGDSTPPSPSQVALVSAPGIDPYTTFGLTEITIQQPAGFPASCQAYCVAGERKYRIEGYSISSPGSFIQVATTTKDSASCAASPRTQTQITTTTNHENIHANQWIDSINYSNNLIKVNQSYEDNEYADCLADATQISGLVELRYLNEEFDQDNHVNHSGFPIPYNYCDANGVTVEGIDGYY